MIGKILLGVLGVVLLFLFIALRIRAYLRFKYEHGELQVLLKYAWLSIPLFPKESKKDTENIQENPEPSESAEQVKQKKKINRDQILYTIDTLPPIILKALKRFGRRIKIEPLKIHVLVATSDPADTAMLFGRIQAVLAAVLPSVHRYVKIEEQDIRLFTDFCEEDMDFIVDAGIGISPGDILNIAFCAIGGVLKWFVGFKRRATKENSEKNNSRDTTAQAEKAA